MGSVFRSLGFDRAIGYTLVLKLWQSCAGLVGIFLITVYFSDDKIAPNPMSNQAA